MSKEKKKKEKNQIETLDQYETYRKEKEKRIRN